MSNTEKKNIQQDKSHKMNLVYQKLPKPLPNYTLSTVCPACGEDTYKLACKVRCAKCGFMWDCSEL